MICHVTRASVEYKNGFMLSVTVSFLILLVVNLTHGDVSVHNPFYCYSEDPVREWIGLGGIRSRYEPNRGQFINANVSTCQPSKFWMFGRHGARLPFEADLPDLIRVVTSVHNRILANYRQGRTTLCASDFELLKNWQYDPNVTMDVASELSASGWNEMKEQAQRFQAAFPTLLPSTYSRNDYYFRTSNFQRTRFSLNAFADGLFGDNGHEQVYFEDISEPDLFMRAYIYCPAYMELDADRTEMNAFIAGPEYQEMVMQVSARLGFHSSDVLRTSEISLLAQQCKYEQLWNLNYTTKSPICAAFSVANALVIEYSSDIDWYLRLGYGRPEYRRLFENVPCFILQDMLRFIQSNDVNDQRARLFNGHIYMLLILLHFDAFAGDVPLTRHNLAQQTQRAWRTTDNFPMAANLVVVRYDCADGDNDILFLYNEKPLQLPGCDANGVCKQSLVLHRFGRYLNANCSEIYCTNS